jgi:hypothetical protein
MIKVSPITAFFVGLSLAFGGFYAFVPEVPQPPAGLYTGPCEVDKAKSLALTYLGLTVACATASWAIENWRSRERA